MELTVLIAEVNPELAEMFRASLQRHGYRVLTASGGASTLRVHGDPTQCRTRRPLRRLLGCLRFTAPASCACTLAMPRTSWYFRPRGEDNSLIHDRAGRMADLRRAAENSRTSRQPTARCASHGQPADIRCPAPHSPPAPRVTGELY